MSNVIAIPYINEEEVSLLLKIGSFIKKQNKNQSSYEFLLLNKKTVKPSGELLDVFSGIAPSKCVEFDLSQTSYPEGVDEFFWKTMEYINKHSTKDGGFVFWMESDVIPIRSNWIDLLEDEWKNHPGRLCMGLYISKKYCKNFTIPEHINGSACYSKDISTVVQCEYRNTCFDTSLFPYLKKAKKYHKSDSFKFSYIYSLLEDIENDKNVILHGYSQDKSKFIQKTINLVESPKFRKSWREKVSAINKKKLVCCKWKAATGIFASCPIHEKNTFFSRYRNIWIMCCFRLVPRILRILSRIVLTIKQNVWLLFRLNNQKS